MRDLWRRGEDVPAGFVLAAGGSALLGIGALAAGSDGAVGGVAVLCLCAAVTVVGGSISERWSAASLGAIGWLTTTGFSAPPYAQLRLGGHVAGRAAIVLAASVAVASVIGEMRRVPPPPRFTLKGVDTSPRPEPVAPPTASVRQLLGAVEPRRRAAGLLLSATTLPLVTIALVDVRTHLTVADALLVYLAAVVAVTLIGGFLPAVASAAAASLLVNWYFTPPLHTFAVDRLQDILALALFVLIAVSVSGVVHLAARRSAEARRSRDEADVLLQLARTILGGADTPRDIVDHLVVNFGGAAGLFERVGDSWVRVAGDRLDDPPNGSRPTLQSITVRPGLELRVSPALPTTLRHQRLLVGFAAQAAAALDRERLRAQAEQSEMLAAGNRMKTALLAAVSHDLRTPLASVKAAVSSLRQTDVEWSELDRAELLATIEESADRLTVLIENLLDMSRVQTGALQPLLRPVAVDEIAPIAVGSLGASRIVEVQIPEDLPLINTDPGLLERVLSNLLSNALRFSPENVPPTIWAVSDDGHVDIAITDHGPGIPADAESAVFEPFQRLGDQPSGTGVGLGLAVAKGFTEALGGTIRAERTPGGGLTMIVTVATATNVRPAATSAGS